MKKKKLIIFIIIIGILTAILLSVLLTTNSINYHIVSYDKYGLTIIINTLKNGKNDTTTIQFKTDGKISKASTSKNNLDAFLIDGKLKYLDNETVYTLKVDNFYDDLITELVKIKRADIVEERDSYVNYTALLDSKQVNKLLKSLSILGKVSQSYIVKFSVNESRISSVNLSLKDVGDYDKIDVMMNYSELPSTYEISTKALENIHRPYKQESATENIFELSGENDEK